MKLAEIVKRGHRVIVRHEGRGLHLEGRVIDVTEDGVRGSAALVQLDHAEGVPWPEHAMSVYVPGVLLGASDT